MMQLVQDRGEVPKHVGKYYRHEPPGLRIVDGKNSQSATDHGRAIYSVIEVITGLHRQADDGGKYNRLPKINQLGHQVAPYQHLLKVRIQDQEGHNQPYGSAGKP